MFLFSQSIFRYINTNYNSKCNKAFSTLWIWNLHDHAHDFDIQQSSTSLITRKVFSSNLAHLSLVVFWISGMHFHGAYFANYYCWLKDGKHSFPSSHLAYSLIGQDILNDHNSNQYSYAIRITSCINQTQIQDSFEICSSCFTNRYNYLSQWILFSYAHAVHISLLQEIQLFIHSSSYAYIRLELYKLCSTSNSHLTPS